MVFVRIFVATKIACISNPFVVTGMTWFAGVAFYISTVNGLGYVLPILAVFWLSLLIMIAVIVWCYFLPSEPKKKDYPPRWVLVSVWILALAAGVAYARTNASDWDSLIHYPVPATILEGNFPVRDPFNPWNRYGYHYAGMLLAAATTALTGVELATSYAIQPLFSAGALVFFSAAIGYVLTRSWKGGLLVALIGCAGGGFHWLYGASVFRDLYSTYILGDPLNPDYQTVFRYVSYMFGSIRAQPIINTLEHRAVGMGVGALMASLYSTYALVQAATRRDRIIWMLFFVVFTSVLALTLETAYAVLFAGIIAMVALYKIVPMPKGTIPYLLGALFVSFTVVAFQGGVITESLTFQGYTSPSAFLYKVCIVKDSLMADIFICQTSL